jgi:hypothetical protein
MGTFKLTEQEKNEILKKHKDAIKKDHDKKEENKKGLQKPAPKPVPKTQKKSTK